MVSDETKGTVDFSELISGHYGELTKSEKRIADYLRKNQEESAFLSAGEIADRLGLSEATIVRFARTIGFGSYPAMRIVLVRASSDLLDEGWFGPGRPHPQLAERIGDLTLVMNDRYTVKDWTPGESRHLHIGNHGGATGDELLIPLVVAKR